VACMVRESKLGETGRDGRLAFHRFIGISLGGGRGKTTAVARLEPGREPGSLVLAEARARRGHRGGGDVSVERDTIAFRDEVLVSYLDEWVDERTVVAIDAPLTLPPCVRCQLACPGVEACSVPAVAWMRRHSPNLVLRKGRSDPGKPRVTPYTQRATELLLERVHLQPREALGQGMGPRAARAAFLRRRLSRLRLNENLIEVHPRATMIRLFGSERERWTRRGEQVGAWEVRKEMLRDLAHGLELDRVWPELVVRDVHVFHAVVSAFTALMWSQQGWRGPADLLEFREQRQGIGGVQSVDPEVPETLASAVADLGDLWLEDGWIWTPPTSAVR